MLSRIPFRAVGSVVLLITLCTIPIKTSAAPAQRGPLNTIQASVGSLPAPFSKWHVSIRHKPKDPPGTLTLSYNSPILRKRTTNTVFLPASYSARGTPSPALYYLHGTVHPQLDNPLFNLRSPSQELSLLAMASEGGGYKQTQIMDFPSQRSRANFLVVAPDTDPKDTWCESCFWVNGKDHLLPPQVHPVTAQQVPAEDVLYKEVLPLVQSAFNVRTDRGGRGITGFSMGGASAFVQGFRHPDMFSYVAPISGGYDLINDPQLRTVVDGVGWLRDQGYGLASTNSVELRNFSPADIAPNFAGSGAHLMISAGDLCLPPTDKKGEQDCAEYPPPLNPYATFVEQMLRNNLDRSLAELPRIGVNAQQVRFSGVHGVNNHRVYSDVIVPGANRVFANNTKTSDSFRYRTVDSSFNIWGYYVSVRRNYPEFLQMEKARHDGRAFSLRGSGQVAVRTPPVFEAGRSYRVTFSSADGHRVSGALTKADNQGSLPIQVDLNNGQYGTDQRTTLDLFGRKNSSFAHVTVSTG